MMTSVIESFRSSNPFDERRNEMMRKRQLMPTPFRSMARKSCLLLVIFFAIFTQNVLASDGKIPSQNKSTTSPACPSGELPKIYSYLRENAPVCDLPMKKLLPYKRIDLHEKNHPSLVTEMVEYRLIRDFLKKISDNKLVPSIIEDSDDRVRVLFYGEKQEGFVYEFTKEKSGLWYISSVENRSLISDDNRVVPNWLEWFFMTTEEEYCCPSIYYRYLGNRFHELGILKHLGYPAEIRRTLVPDWGGKEDAYLYHIYYKNTGDKFMGFDVLEMEFPYWFGFKAEEKPMPYNVTEVKVSYPVRARSVITVDAPVEKLRDAVAMRWGRNLAILPQFDRVNTRAHLVQNMDGTSSFFCSFTEE